MLELLSKINDSELMYKKLFQVNFRTSGTKSFGYADLSQTA